MSETTMHPVTFVNSKVFHNFANKANDIKNS